MKFDVDFKDIYNVNSKDTQINAKKKLAIDIMRDSDPFTPFRYGYLSQSVYVDTFGDYIEYRVPYANAMYEGVVNGRQVKNWTRYYHPKAGSHWVDRASEIYLERWTATYQKNRGIL